MTMNTIQNQGIHKPLYKHLNWRWKNAKIALLILGAANYTHMINALAREDKVTSAVLISRSIRLILPINDGTFNDETKV